MKNKITGIIVGIYGCMDMLSLMSFSHVTCETASFQEQMVFISSFIFVIIAVLMYHKINYNNERNI